MTHEHPKNEKYICKLKIKIKACFNFKENQNEPTDDKKKSSKLLTTKFMKKKKTAQIMQGLLQAKISRARPGQLRTEKRPDSYRFSNRIQTGPAL